MQINVTSGMPSACQYCGATKESDGSRIDLRPYGKGGAWICFDCGMKPDNKSTTEKMFNDIMDSNDIVVIFLSAWKEVTKPI